MGSLQSNSDKSNILFCSNIMNRDDDLCCYFFFFFGYHFLTEETDYVTTTDK